MKLLILIIITLFLSGCGNNDIKERLIPVHVPVLCDNFGKITGIRPLPVVFVSGKDKEGNEILGLRGNYYSNLSINGADVLRYISEQKKAIGYYEKCIADHNAVQLNEEGGPE